jgi:TPR repeat protein
MGTSAFYANDIASAFSQLKEADNIFNSCQVRPEDSKKRAYTKYFLGIIEKNWQQETGVVKSNLKEAYEYLHDAFKLVKEDNKQFLIPITLAEVQSYRNDQQNDANKLIDDIFDRFNKIGSDSLDKNQGSLLVRTYLLKGNIAYKDSPKDAIVWYKKAIEKNKTNAYAHLSLAHSLPPDKTDEAKEHWKLGLDYLIRSGSIQKRELATRVIALIWAIVAAKKCDDINSSERYENELESTAHNLHSIDQRIPLFFSPLSKDILTFDDLKKELDQYLKNLTKT